MGKVILTADGIDTQQIYDEIVKCVNPNTKVGIITTAKPEKENRKSPQNHKKLFENMGAKVDFFDFETQDTKLVHNFDIIFVEGGSPYRLMYWIRKTNFDIDLKKFLEGNGIYIGRSAGSMVVGNNFKLCDYLTPDMNVEKITDLNGLSYVDVSICPHYSDFLNVYENCEAKIQQCEKDNNMQIYRLNNGEALVFDDCKKKEYKKLSDEVKNLI